MPKIVNVVIPWIPTENVVTGLQFCFSVGIIALAVQVVYSIVEENRKGEKEYEKERPEDFHTKVCLNKQMCRRGKDFRSFFDADVQKE